MCPDFEIKEWNERNFPIAHFPFANRMYDQRKWAFVADYARLHTLEKEGGFYLDTDMLLVKSLSPLIPNECVLGEELPGIISAGMIGAIPHHPFIAACKEQYDTPESEVVTIPRVLSKVYGEYQNKDALTVFPPKAFYPFDSDHIKEYHGQNLGEETIGVHLWHYSWGHPLNKLFKRLKIHRLGTRIVEILGIKEILKKLLGFI